MKSILGVLAALAVLLAALPASGQSTSTTVSSAGVMSPATSSATDAPACWDPSAGDAVEITEVRRHVPGFAANDYPGIYPEPAGAGGGFTLIAVSAHSVACDIRSVDISVRSLGSKHEARILNRLGAEFSGGQPGDRTASHWQTERFAGPDGPDTLDGWLTASLVRMNPRQAYAVEATLHMR